MAPITRRGVDYLPASYNCSGANIDPTSPSASETNTQEDMQALMYIVCVLLFYSLGIVVGIITYLKRERQEIEESKMFDEFVTLINTRQPNNRLIKVQEVIQRLDELQRNKIVPPPPPSKPDYSELLPGKINYTSVFPLLPDVSDSVYYGNYETLDNEAMDVVPKPDQETSRHEDGYHSDGDPFQNKRLSQVVAQILDGHQELVPADECDGLVDVPSDEYSGLEEGAYSDDSLSTDFIHYNEEPKNKELFRETLRSFAEYDSDSGRDSAGQARLSPKMDEFPSPPEVKDLSPGSVSPDNVFSPTAKVHSTVFPVVENSEAEVSTHGHARDGTGFRWSVTSV